MIFSSPRRYYTHPELMLLLLLSDDVTVLPVMLPQWPISFAFWTFVLLLCSIRYEKFKTMHEAMESQLKDEQQRETKGEQTESEERTNSSIAYCILMNIKANHLYIGMFVVSFWLIDYFTNCNSLWHFIYIYIMFNSREGRKKKQRCDILIWCIRLKKEKWMKKCIRDFGYWQWRLYLIFGKRNIFFSSFFFASNREDNRKWIHATALILRSVCI